MIEDWQNRIKAAAARGERLAIRGSGSKSFLQPATAAGTAIDTRDHAGIVEYEPNELAIVVRCGTPLAEVEKTMAAAGQMLAFEPAHFGEGATIGGTVATGLSGPRRPYAGPLRDYVLGGKIIDGKGDLLAFGGKVMKNVAGFDVARLLAGSMGTLGVITEVAFKCLPLPKAQQTRIFELDAGAAITAMNRWYAEANPITASAWVDGRLYLRLAGAEPAVRSSTQKLGGEALADDTAWWHDWREQKHAFFAGEQPLLRIACRSVAPHVTTTGASAVAIDWGGAQRWLRAPLTSLAHAREWALANDGHATLYRGDGSSADRAVAQPAALAAVQQKIKSSFDPYTVFPEI